ncbi:MAG TPA: hypothetical protein VGP85_15635 [Pyrinomonadaceae bacterium]|jgi:DUF4097 and DUF4098 domain-containing protein YvlB|nr:hypothetical protein [Pyrinomonadaceae bacterium]
MKRILLLVALVMIAGIAGIVRSHSKAGDFDRLVSHDASDQVREEIRQSYQLAPGASVELMNINGAIRIETSDTNTAEVYIERLASSNEALGRRKVIIEADSNNLRIRGEKGDVGFLERLFGSNPSEKLTLKLPREIALHTKGVNGALIVAELDGPVEVRGVNGRVQIAAANGAEFKGINGNITIGLKRLNSDGVTLGGINGNIELQLTPGINAAFDAHGINGNVASDLSDVSIDRSKRGTYSGQIGSGGSSVITAKGINGNIRLTRSTLASAPSEAVVKEKESNTN